jgi:hypothetical protein
MTEVLTGLTEVLTGLTEVLTDLTEVGNNCGEGERKGSKAHNLLGICAEEGTCQSEVY